MIAFFGAESWQEALVRKAFPGEEIMFSPEDFADDTLAKAKDATILSGTIYSAVSRAQIEKLPSLKCIATRSTGYDHIDLAAAKARGIVVCNVPTYGENTVAEHTFALILALSRKIPQAVERTKRGDFSLTGLRGFDLKGKTLGVIGVGHIGQHVVRIGKGFEMRVLGVARHPNEKLAAELGFTYVDLKTALQESDIVSLNVPATKETHHLLNAETIAWMKKGSVIVNTARGEVIDTEALVRALDSGQIGGAALDVLEEECFVKEEAQLLSPQFPKECDLKTILHNHILAHRENVIITPHNAFNSHEAVRRILHITIENINAFLAGNPQNVVQ